MAKKVNANLYNLIYAVLFVVLGVLCIIEKSAIVGTILSVGVTVVGIALIAIGVLKMWGTKKFDIVAALSIVGGVLVIVFGWTFVNVILIVLGALLIAYNVLALIRGEVKGKVAIAKFICGLLVGIFLIVGQASVLGQAGGIIADLMFIIIGVMLIVYGGSMVISMMSNKKN